MAEEWKYPDSEDTVVFLTRGRQIGGTIANKKFQIRGIDRIPVELASNGPALQKHFFQRYTTLPDIYKFGLPSETQALITVDGWDDSDIAEKFLELAWGLQP